MGAHREPCPRGTCRPIRTLRSGVEVCNACGDRFPCKSARCGHLDCADRRAELALRKAVST